MQIEDLGKFSSDQASSFPHHDYEDENSRQYSEQIEEVDRDMNSQEEHTPSQPNDYSGVEHRQQKVNVATPILLGQFWRFIWQYGYD